MMLDSESASVFGIGVANGKFLRDVSVADEMLLMRRVPCVDRECGVAHPLARAIDPTAVNATRAGHIGGPDATGNGDESKQPRREQRSHPQTFHFAVPATCPRLEPERAR